MVNWTSNPHRQDDLKDAEHHLDVALDLIKTAGHILYTYDYPTEADDLRFLAKTLRRVQAKIRAELMRPNNPR